jgi:acyl transferase domain-containing protein
MMLCRLSPKTVQDLLSGHPEFRSLRIACENGPENTVVGGSKAELEALAGLCKSTNVKATMVDVPFAFHTFAMDPMMESFSHQLRSVRLKSPAIPVGSGLRGRILSLDEPIEPSYFAEHCRETLQFHRLTDDIVATYSGADKAVALIEMGPSAASKWPGSIPD